MHMNKMVRLAAILACGLVLGACKNQGDKKQEGAEQTTAPVTHGTVEKEVVTVSGKVLEKTDSNEFTYLKVATDTGERWVVVPATTVTIGEAVVIEGGEVLQNFPSKAMGQTFAELIAAPGIKGKEPIKSRMEETGHEGLDLGDGAHPGVAGKDATFASAMQDEAAKSGAQGQQEFDPSILGSSKAIVPFVELKVEKADGKNSYTVGQLFDQSQGLDGKKIRVRGQIVKVSPNIMGKNWLHIQDGTGNTLKNTHDLVVTTKATPEKGEIVVVEGDLHANRDFGAGYQYPVIIEDAVISK